MAAKRDQPMLGFDMKLSQSNLSRKVVLDALGDIHHTPLVGKQLSLIFVNGKDIPLESSIIQILGQSPLTSIRTFAHCPT